MHRHCLVMRSNYLKIVLIICKWHQHRNRPCILFRLKQYVKNSQDHQQLPHYLKKLQKRHKLTIKMPHDVLRQPMLIEDPLSFSYALFGDSVPFDASKKFDLFTPFGSTPHDVLKDSFDAICPLDLSCTLQRYIMLHLLIICK